MSVSTIVASILPSVGLSVASAWYLGRTLLSHQLSKDLESYRKDLDRKFELEKQELAGKIKERVDTILGDKAADRDYALGARKRLYQVIGPLKFQLVLACRDAAHRIEGHGSGVAYDMSVRGHYGVNTIYRILRPIAISELIEEQIAYTDFSVDDSAISLLRFKKSVTLAFSGSAVVLDHPDIDWSYQRQHLFFDTVSEAAQLLIRDGKDGKPKRVVGFHEFKSEFTDLRNSCESLEILSQIIDDFNMTTKPIFWIRLIAFGHNCRELVKTAGANLKFEYSRFDVRYLLKKTEDKHIVDKLEDYAASIDTSVLEKL